MAKLTLTAQQQAVVENRGGSLLVSAAAGSGKTKVLVDRLFRYVTEERCNIDDFLIITYTKAAAAELRSKIASELSRRLAETPGDRHLRRQDGEAEVHGAVHTARRLHRAGKGPRQHKHQAHDHHIFVAHAFGNAGQLFPEGALGVLQKSHQKRNEKAHNGGHGVKVPEQNAAADEHRQKHQDRQQRPGVPLFHKISSSYPAV